MAEQLYRGSADGANCEDCPFSTAGSPTRPVFSEYPEDPLWIIIGDGPGRTEVQIKRPFAGQNGMVVEQILGKIGRPRSQLAVMNATLCMSPYGAKDSDMQRAAEACKPRLQQELAQFPGKPILTLGAVTARNVIPKAALDAIDPPDAPKAVKKQQKLKQQPTRKRELLKQKKIGKLGEKRLKRMLAYRKKQLVAEYRRTRKAKPDAAWLNNELLRSRPQMELKAGRDAILEYDVVIKEQQFRKLTKAKQDLTKPRKHKPAKIGDIVSTTFLVDVDGSGERCVIPAIHPAALRGGGASIGGSHTPDLAFINMIYDAVKVDALARGKDIWLKFPVEVEYIDTNRAIKLFLSIVHEALAEGEFALDLETYVDDPDRHSALMAYVAKIRALGIATKNRAVSVYWDLLPKWCHTYLQLLLNRSRMITHNGLYDRTVLRNQHYGFIIDAGLFEDTLLAHHASFPGNAHRLQIVTSQFFSVEPWKSEFRNAEETPEKLTLYNAKDTFSTKALMAPLAIHVKRTKTEEVYALDKKMAEIASAMHLAGMPVDRDTNQQLLTTFTKNVVEARRAVEDKARDPKLREQIWHHLALQQATKQRKLDPVDFEERYQLRLGMIRHDPDWRWKISAGKDIAALLLAMGVGLYQTTDAGLVSTKKDILEGLVDVPIVRDILNFRENDKLLSTFIWQIFDRMMNGEIVQYGYADGDDRIHPIWGVHKITGRWASRWPVVSNVPKDKWKKLLGDAVKQILGLTLPERGEKFTDGSGQVYRRNKDDSIAKMTRPNLRAQIRARPGRMLVGFDFSQLEARGIALVSGDPFLLDVFSRGQDIHRECARVIFAGFDQLDPDSQKQIREQTKPMEYGAFYGGSVETLHKQMLKEGHNVKLVDVARAVETLMRKMAGVVKWQQDTVRQASQPPYQIKDLILGRTRHWPMGNVEPSEAMNYGIQTLGASIMNQGMARMYFECLPKYREAYPITQIHDAAVFECWEDDAPLLAEDIDRVFPQEREREGRIIKFPVETKIAKSWDKV